MYNRPIASGDCSVHHDGIRCPGLMSRNSRLFAHQTHCRFHGSLLRFHWQAVNQNLHFAWIGLMQEEDQQPLRFLWILNTLATPSQRTKQGTYLETKRSRLRFPLLSHAWSPPKLQYSARTNLSLRALWVFGSACFHSLPNPKLIFWAILVNRVIQKRTITYTNMTEGSLWPQAPIFPRAIEASHIYMIKTSPSNRFASVWSSPPALLSVWMQYCSVVPSFAQRNVPPIRDSTGGGMIVSLHQILNF